MITLVTLYLLLVAAVIVWIILRDGFTRYEELISLRNFFLLGMLIFQVTGTAYTLGDNAAGEFIPADMAGSAVAFAGKLTIFLILFFIAGRMMTGPVDRFIGRRKSGTFRMAPFNLLVIAVSTIPAGLFCQFVLNRVPIIGPGMGYLAFGLYAVGAGLASWVAAPRLANPVYLIPSSAIILFCMALTFYQNFGRRDLLGVIVAVMWAAYFARWRALPPAKMTMRLTALAAAGVVLIFAVTSVRSPEFRDRGIIENIMSLREAKLSDGLADVLSGQAAGMASMWLIESRPESKEYDTLHSVRMVLLMPVPRAIWPNKPTALALTMPQQEVHIAKRPDNYNIGPGIIGHVENDNPWLALWMYPLFLGALIRVLDRLAAWYADDPFIVLPMGAAIGQFIGMPRGELGTFFFIGMINIIGAFVIMQSLAWVLKTLGFIKRDAEWEGDEYQEYEEATYEHSQEEPYV